MDKIQVFARSNNAVLFFVCPRTRVIRPLYRIQ